MPIPVPNLDDRSYDDLVREMLARIPAHTPEWTNPAPGDPGRTLIELFAWLTDTLLYRVNLIPEKQRLTFLNLLGEQMRPASAARTLVALAHNTPVPSRAFIPPLSTLAGSPNFETRGPVNVLPIIGECYVKRKLTAAEMAQSTTKRAQLASIHGVSQTMPYLTTTLYPAGRAESFDIAGQTVDGCLYIALLLPETLLAKANEVSAAIAGGGATPCYLNVGLSPTVEMPDYGKEHLSREPVPVSWEICTLNKDTNSVLWRPLTVDDDTTGGLATDGVVRLVMPEANALYSPPNNVRRNIKAGVGPDSPPRLDDPRFDDPKKNGLLLGWLRLKPKGQLNVLKLAWAGINAVEVDARTTTRNLIIAQGTGQPDQRVKVPNEGSIEVESFELEVEGEGKGFELWKRVDDLILAGLHEQRFTLNAESRELGFGDGVRGRMPAAGARIRVKRMRCGGGAAGNVPTGTLSTMTVATASFKVHQALAAFGGDDGESLADALRRIPQSIRTRDRAVTADDYRYLAANVPGVHVGRVEVMPGFRPLTRDAGMPGVISVMALPDRTTFEAPYPRVDRPFIETIVRFLDERKPVGTELYVTGCEYVPLAITVGVDHAPSEGERVYTAVQAALKQHLFALRPGGPQGDGWPLGGTVRRRELEIVVSRVAGVLGVDGPRLFVRRGNETTWSELTTRGASGDIELALFAWQLPELCEVAVATGSAPLKVEPPPPGSNQGEIIAVPIVPEVC